MDVGVVQVATSWGFLYQGSHFRVIECCVNRMMVQRITTFSLDDSIAVHVASVQVFRLSAQTLSLATPASKHKKHLCIAKQNQAHDCVSLHRTCLCFFVVEKINISDK